MTSTGEQPRATTAGEGHRLTVVGGLAALSLDAMASVAYGPQAIVPILAVPGGESWATRSRSG